MNHHNIYYNQKFIWKKNFKIKRISHVFFRKKISIPTKIKSAILNITASTRYHLFINEKFIGAGPARAYPEFLEYDTYDISEYLKEGKNIIAVDVCHFGENTFHYIKAEPSFSAWGNIELCNNNTIFISPDSEWLCMESKSCDNDAPSFSFAIGPIQIEDKRKSSGNWKSHTFNDENWEKAVVLRKSQFKKLYPRQIPPLSCELIKPKKIISFCKATTADKILSFRLSQEMRNSRQIKYSDAVSFARTYIFSPLRQDIKVGVWWGEVYLNSNFLPKNKINDERMLMEQQIFHLEKGWNELFLSYRMTVGFWEFHLSYPSNSKITFSSEKIRNKLKTFEIAGPFRKNIADKILNQKPWLSFGKLKFLNKHWKTILASEIAVSPVRNLAWFKEEKKIQIPEKIDEIKIPAKGKYSVIFDFGKINLGRISFTYKAPRGTIFDFGYAEELKGKKPNYEKNFLVNAGEREIASGKSNTCETFFPRGLRYFEILVQNNKKEVKIKDLSLIEELYPLKGDAQFKCSDKKLNKLWEYGCNTLKLCAEEVFTDCPWRERTLYAGDLLVESATNFIYSSDYRLVKRSLEVLLQSQGNKGWLQSRAPNPRSSPTLYDYPMISLINANWYCKISGDVIFAKRSYPIFKKLISNLLSHKDSDGILSSAYPVFIEHGYRINSGKLCVLNALAVGTLHSWADMLRILNKNYEAEIAEKEADELEKRIIENFWDEEQNCFVDQPCKGRQKQESFNAAANSWTLLFCKKIQKERICGALDKIIRIVDNFSIDNESRTVSPYGAFYLFATLYKYGWKLKRKNTLKLFIRRCSKNPPALYGNMQIHLNH
ncbi:MAG TPA: family 78 glycoside hydrolase catalytic domain [Victivallales bacterium]|nr:family 78 glycoside hydrolase catalytic domain [Victivallales bacterium]